MASADRRALTAAKRLLAAIGAGMLAPTALAQEPAVVTGISAEQLFDLASQFEAREQTTSAERIYDALEKDARVEVRNEARFRHAQLLSRQDAFDRVAELYRAILAEQPDAPRVRIELAAVLARNGDMSGARRELKAARAGGLPSDVARVVDQYAAALRSTQPYGASLEVAFAPSNNINRATTATTLDTVLAPFQLSDDARAKSGVGVRLGGQAYYRTPVATNSQLVFRLAGQGSVYRSSSFNDVIGSAQVGLESEVAGMKVRPFVGRSYRWYGGDYYAVTDTGSVEVERPLDASAQLTTDVGVGRANYQLNDLQDGNIYTGSLLYERALSPKSGAGVGLSLQRLEARDPGYATTSGGAQILLWRRLGNISAFADLRVTRLEADERLSLFPERRKDWQYSTTIGAALPRFAIRGFAPVLRISFEENESTVGIYAYSRLAGDFGFTRAF